jgi:hypothetical protein
MPRLAVPRRRRVHDRTEELEATGRAAVLAWLEASFAELTLARWSCGASSCCWAAAAWLRCVGVPIGRPSCAWPLRVNCARPDRSCCSAKRAAATVWSTPSPSWCATCAMTASCHRRCTAPPPSWGRPCRYCPTRMTRTSRWWWKCSRCEISGGGAALVGGVHGPFLR